MATRVLIDAGHGGSDPGAVATHCDVVYREADIVYDYALAAKYVMERLGYIVHLTRERDTRPSILVRRLRTYTQRYDAFISIHLNASENPDANGFETWCRARDLLWATALHQTLIKRLPMHDRGVKTDDRWHKRQGGIPVLKTRCPSALIEIGFLTNPTDFAELVRRATRLNFAYGLAEALRGS